MAMIAAFVGVMMTSCKKENETVSIVLHPTSAYNYKDYVTAIIIHGDSDGDTFIRHNTTVEYGRYLYINSVIEFNEL